MRNRFTGTRSNVSGRNAAPPPPPVARRYAMSMGLNYNAMSPGPAGHFPPIEESLYLTRMHEPMQIPVDPSRAMQDSMAFILQQLAAPGAPAVPPPVPPPPSAGPGGAPAAMPVDVDEEDADAELRAAIELSKVRRGPALRSRDGGRRGKRAPVSVEPAPEAPEPSDNPRPLHPRFPHSPHFAPPPPPKRQ